MPERDYSAQAITCPSSQIPRHTRSSPHLEQQIRIKHHLVELQFAEYQPRIRHIALQARARPLAIASGTASSPPR